MKTFLFLFLTVMPLACSSPRSVIRVNNKADKTTTTISQTTGDGGSVSVKIDPQLDVKVDSTNIL